MSLLRSFLFAPGNHARRSAKVFAAGADAAILDLEDAVAVSEKVATRASVAAALARPHRCPVYVRVNAMETEFCFGDIYAVVQKGLDGIVLPKVESAAGLLAADWMLGALERERGLAPGSVDLMPIIETAKGLAALREILGARSRIRRVAFGAGDFTFDMSIAWRADEAELAGFRAEIALASRAAGLEPPVDSVWIELGDAEGLRRSAEAVRRLGYQGKLCIHPDQVAIVNAAFTPGADEVAKAERIVAAFERAEADGSAALQVDGRFIDYPIVHQARKLLDMAARIRARDAAAPSEA
jgi:citrate lyase subunit beta/citryl-CoA lyase